MAGNVLPLRSVEDEASEWVARLERGCSSEQRKRLEAWLAADPRHQAVFSEMTRCWQHLGAVAEVAARLSSPPPCREERARRIRVLPWALAATVILSLAALFLYRTVIGPGSRPQVYTTEVGAQRTFTLDDRSIVDLNTATRLEVEFTPDARTVRLTAGEALFNVARDSRRPFTVIAGSSIVHAVGTAFSVRLDADRTHVVVTEGRVRVTPLQSDSTAEKLLAAGEAVSIATEVGQVATVKPHDLDRALAWRRGILNVEDQPLGEVIAEVERYSATRFQVADATLNDIKVGGYFKANDVNAFLTLLEGQFPIRAERTGPDTIILHRRQ